uniref:GRF-type domain-containing protein n=1 Tax=Daucus carota subsp. sativus TaxID=79200 RepID=A0A162B1W9_DAUCS
MALLGCSVWIAMAGSSTGSIGSIGSMNICDCGKRAAMYTSWSLKNPGRRFFTCSEKSVSILLYLRC